MTHGALLWSLPASWTQFELLAPDVYARIEEEMRNRLEGVVDEAELTRALRIQGETIRSIAEDGVILLATYAKGSSDSPMPPAGLSLTLALANRPTSGTPDDQPGGRATDSSHSTGGSAVVSDPKPLVLEDTDMVAFTRERRGEVRIPGVDKPLNQFQAQAFVLPNGQAGMAVITVTTFDPDCEGDARNAAHDFANSLCFVTADEADEDKPS